MGKGNINNWPTLQYGDVLDYIQPTKYIVQSTEYNDSYKIPVLTPGKSFIKGYTNETEGIFDKLPVIIFDDFTTATKFVNFPFKVKSSAMKILAAKNSDVNIKFIFYLMQTVRIQNDTHKRYWISEYAKRKLTLPSIAEQNEIVSKIEELFSELDNGIAQLKTAQQQLNTYRQSVLKWAFEGKLTNKNVKDGELPEGWKWVKLREVADAIDPQPSHRTPAISEDGIPYVGIGEVDKETGKIDFDNARKVSKIVLKEHIERYNLYDGDFIIGKIGTIGKPFKIPSKRFFTLSANVVLIQSNRSKVLPNYLFYLTKSTIIEKQFSSGSKATTQAAFGIKKVRELNIPVCSIDEQKLLVEEIDRRLSVSDKLQETIDTALVQSESLRQSILKQAFEGKLVKN